MECVFSMKFVSIESFVFGVDAFLKGIKESIGENHEVVDSLKRTIVDALDYRFIIPVYSEDTNRSSMREHIKRSIHSLKIECYWIRLNDSLQSQIQEFVIQDILSFDSNYIAGQVNQTESKGVLEQIELLVRRSNSLTIIDSYFMKGEMITYFNTVDRGSTVIIDILKFIESEKTLRIYSLGKVSPNPQSIGEIAKNIDKCKSGILNESLHKWDKGFCICNDKENEFEGIEPCLIEDCFFPSLDSESLRSKSEDKAKLIKLEINIAQKGFKYHYHGRYLIVRANDNTIGAWYLEKGLSFFHDIDRHPSSYKDAQPLNIMRLRSDYATNLIRHLSNRKDMSKHTHSLVVPPKSAHAPQPS